VIRNLQPADLVELLGEDRVEDLVVARLMSSV
jgi:hypothetical protein